MRTVGVTIRNPGELHTTFSLSAVLKDVSNAIKQQFSGKIWISCEIARLNFHSQSGHCYAELVEKSGNQLIAQVKANIWKDTYQYISRKFEQLAGAKLSGGIRVLMLCSVGLHPVYGFSLTVHDIDPAFTIGEMVIRRNATIQQMKSEGIFERNKLLPFPRIPSKLAVISVDSSRGLHDFISTILSDRPGPAIYPTLFPAILQGEKALPSFVSAFRKIIADGSFQAVCIIRGGAGDTGLACYDEYELARLVAMSPVPVVTGIGHATNVTVTEMVAYRNLITPTAAAAFFVSIFREESLAVSRLRDSLARCIPGIINAHKGTIDNAVNALKAPVRIQRMHQKNLLNTFSNAMKTAIDRYLYERKDELREAISATYISKETIEKHKAGILLNEDRVRMMDPVNVLSRGYSITRKNGKAVRDIADLNEEEIIETQLFKGTITTVVKSKSA